MFGNWGRIAALGAVSGFAVFIGPALAETPLAVNSGLWEIVTQRDATGMPKIPPEALAGLPPEKRAQIEQAMKNQMKPHVTKSCLTEDQLKRGFSLGDKDSMKNCKKTVLKSTPKVLDMRIECAGPQTATGDIHYEAVDAKTMAATIDMVVNDGEHTMTMKNFMKGKWLGPDCGDIKPHEPHNK